ncbi:MAG: DUF2235 domain-containing protein [Acidobacteria bacterium]|nr:DUF2235 domain-containing protein [Acidobacteriota bacterium]
MALYAFDGTWNEAKKGEDPRYRNTNVVRFFEAYHKRSGRDDFYVEGVGTRFDAVGKVLGGVFGLGVLPHVVAAFGIANLGNTELNIGHHLSLPRASLQYCFHALALDERRTSFLPTRLPGACEVWFRGVHSDVGGGNGNRGLNDIALAWMMRKAQGAGLPIAEEDVAAPAA